MTAELRPAQLLVSVRNADEAREALDGGADIIDVKEPAHGPLGPATREVIGEVLAITRARRPGVLVSAACGEVCESMDSAPQSLPPGLAFAKLGFAQLVDRSCWGDDWKTVRAALTHAEDCALRWIAVIYADHQRAGSPPPQAVVRAAAATGCAGVLIDTFDKQSPALLEQMPVPQLADLVQEVHERGMMFAAAGRLTGEDFCRLPDAINIVAVRSAACREGDRLQAVCSERVAGLVEALRLRRRPDDVIAARWTNSVAGPSG